MRVQNKTQVCIVLLALRSNCRAVLFGLLLTKGVLFDNLRYDPITNVRPTERATGLWECTGLRFGTTGRERRCGTMLWDSTAGLENGPGTQVRGVSEIHSRRRPPEWLAEDSGRGTKCIFGGPILTPRPGPEVGDRKKSSRYPKSDITFVLKRARSGLGNIFPTIHKSKTFK